MARLNKTITLTPGTPIQLSAQFNANTQGNHGVPLFADRIFIQMIKSTATPPGIGYVMTGVPEGVTPTATSSAYLTAQLTPATADTPGGNYEDVAYPKDGTGIDLAGMWVDGDSADPMVVSIDQRV